MIRQLRSRERGMSFWPFVITLVLLLVTLYLWYEASQNDENQKNQIATLRTQFATESGKVAPRTELLDGIGAALGSTYMDSSPEVAAVGAFPSGAAIRGNLTAIADKLREKLTFEIDSSKYVASGAGGWTEKLAGDKIKVSYFPPKAEAATMSLEQLTTAFVDGSARMNADMRRYVEEAGSRSKKLSEAEAGFAKALAAKDTAASEARAASAAAEQAAQARERELKDQLTASEGAKQAAENDRDAAKKAEEATAAKSQRDLGTMKAELQTAMRKDAPFMNEAPDGAVLASGNGLVVIDLGKSNMLMPGTKFTVWGKVKGGALVQKGAISVFSSDANTANCRILDEDASNPIGQGDAISSPVFSKDREIHFAIVGDLRKFGRGQTESKLKSLGAAIDAKVTARTDYLIVGMPASATESIEDSEAYRAAVGYGITRLTEDQLASFTNY